MKNNSNIKDKSECKICMCEYEENEEIKILPCIHSFHTHCIDTWIKKNYNCPVCKHNLKN